MDMLMNITPSPIWITSRDQMPDLVAALAAAPWVALDTESNSMFVYQERICLLQVNAGERYFLIDPLAIDPEGARTESFALLKPLLEDPGRILYLHGAEYDVGVLKRCYGISLSGVWDSQQAASLLGYERTGYGALVEKLCGVKLAKDHSQYDWGTRPLDPLAERYAIDDVVYLPRICELLREQVQAADLADEVAIANRAVEETRWTGGFDPAGLWRIKGVRDIHERDLGLLYALYVWREDLAQAANRPPGRLINNELLLALVRKAPTQYSLLKQMGVKGWLVSEHGEALMAVIREAQSNPPDLPPRPDRRDVSREEDERERRLKDWRRAEAERRTVEEHRAVPLQVILPARSLEYLKRQGVCDLGSVPQLGAKRIARYGEKLLELCQ
jgi:ribonuclease D